MTSILTFSEEIRNCQPDAIPQMVTWYLGDLFKILKNINDTSLNEDDRKVRLMAIEKKYGIPIKNLI